MSTSLSIFQCWIVNTKDVRDESTVDPLFLTSSVMPVQCFHKSKMSRMVFGIWSMFGIEHDLRSLRIHVVPSYRFVEHDFLNHNVIQGCTWLLLHFSVNNSSSHRWSLSICLETSRLASSNLKWGILLLHFRSEYKVLQVDLICASQFCRQRVASGLVKVGGFLSNKTSPAKVTTLPSALAGKLSYRIIASLQLSVQYQIFVLSSL